MPARDRHALNAVPKTQCESISQKRQAVPLRMSRLTFDLSELGRYSLEQSTTMDCRSATAERGGYLFFRSLEVLELCAARRL